MPLFSKLARHLKSPKPPTTPATTSKETPKSPNTEAIVTLSGQAQTLLTSLRDIRKDFYQIIHRIRLLTPETPETQMLFKALCEDPHLRTRNEEWAAIQKAIPIVHKEISRAQEQFSEKRALVEAVVREEWKLRDTIMAGIGRGEEGEDELIDTRFLKEVVEMEEKVQECKDICQALAAEDKIMRIRFAELARYRGAIEGKAEATGGVEGGKLVQGTTTSAGESSAAGAPSAGERQTKIEG
ncbi:hypothetical protein C7212DRAFT_345522 [Tuber magnatum]|uniref:Uncharacterized protein n=1 Tax=Tuber magnatum TaxID=42249 RepID=A0A317SR62_9PEZI|nr:hypothetical protein C7212DRAFT_345522 [Tuber magnatum]